MPSRLNLLATIHLARMASNTHSAALQSQFNYKAKFSRDSSFKSGKNRIWSKMLFSYAIRAEHKHTHDNRAQNVCLAFMFN